MVQCHTSLHFRLLSPQLHIRDVSTAGGVDPKDGNANGPAAGGNSNGGNGGVGKRNNRPPCAAASCGRESRPDSKFCSDGCGVLHAEAFLAKAIRHHVEESAGIDRGRRLRETRELKTRKQQVIDERGEVLQANKTPCCIGQTVETRMLS